MSQMHSLESFGSEFSLDPTRFAVFKAPKASDATIAAVVQCLQSLNARERAVIRARFGLEDGEPQSLKRVAEMFGVTAERIRQIEKKALNRMRHPPRK